MKTSRRRSRMSAATSVTLPLPRSPKVSTVLPMHDGRDREEDHRHREVDDVLDPLDGVLDPVRHGGHPV